MISQKSPEAETAAYAPRVPLAFRQRELAGDEGAAAYAPRVPLARALAAQLAAFAVALALARLVPAAGELDLMGWALAQGVIAARLARGLGLQPWWLPMQALFAPGLAWGLQHSFPPSYALAAFLLLASLYGGVARSRVPLFPSRRAALDALARLLPREGRFTFLDLGCGLGGVLAHLSRQRPAGCYEGVESAPAPFIFGRLRSALSKSACRIAWGDYRQLDFRRYDVVYAYLSPAAMPALWRKARSEMRRGSLLVSNSFAVPGVPPTRTIRTGGATLLVWRM